MPGARAWGGGGRSGVFPLVLVTVLVAMVVMAAAHKGLTHRLPVAQGVPIVPPAAATEGGTASTAPPFDAADVSPGTSIGGSARMLHGDSRHTGRAAGRAPLTLPAKVWSHDVGGPVEAQVVTSPDQQTLYAASLGGSLTALSRGDGSVKWSVALGERSYATPCVADDGTIFAASDAKKVIALTPEGKTKWSLDTDDEADTGLVLSSDGTLIFAAGRKVYGVTQLGFVRWRFAAKRKVYTSPAVAPDGRSFFGSQDHRVYALTPEGGPTWHTDLGADVDGAPVFDDGAVYVGTDADEVVRLNADDGHVIWRTKVGGYVRGTLALTRGGLVAAGVYGPAPREVFLAQGDGTVRMAFAIQGTGAREFGVHGGALEDDAGVLLFGAQDDAVHAIDGTGRLLWSFPTGGDVDSPLTLLEDGSLVFGSDDGNVYLLRGN